MRARVPPPAEHPMKHLLDMQKELMDKVPHDMRPGTYNMAIRAIRLIEAVLMLLSAHGHKPWRPKPLNEDIIAARVTKCHVAFMSFISSSPDEELTSMPGAYLDRRNLISALGVIEETLEYLDSTAFGSSPPERLEEITDVLFFYLELVILGEFSWAEVEREYVRKHAVNLERYSRAKEGDYGWNHRGKEEKL